AYSTGFSDPGYFSKVFRKEFGVSPKEFMSGESKS
ncbi:MAG: AraC family transcriptional regulator, partial [Bacteroides sp.]|nr:AraC family transcriptional regulator [Bacteroides sp.]